ncbi:hypothetical protein STAFG_6847 [Streptomyces afghaniensis 772]|uniref:Uncharacterized protein n=1 Tax=Streptomyces afghaniensis 772 TaxID=1283301 RepID=S4MHS3_9ACTN|nr:hypothetical protein STAFG_6847 [Streptomyces afghaniensis 772]
MRAATCSSASFYAKNRIIDAMEDGFIVKIVS